jgi:trk system potassium uptake protein TrkA
MKIVIVGCGRVGSTLANKLSVEGHEVAVIDKDPRAFKRLAKNFRGVTVEGPGTDKTILEKAGIDRADAFTATTNSDDDNSRVALIAKDEYHVPHVTARLYDPLKAELYRQHGIAAISSTIWAANTLKDLILHPGILEKASFGSGEVKLIEIEVPQHLVGKQVQSLAVPSELHTCTIVRNGKAFIPTSGTIFENGDLLYVAVLSSALENLRKMLGI